MIKRVKFILIYWFCWIIFFDLARLIFILSNKGAWTHGARLDLFSALWYGLIMDASMAAYITFPVLVFVIISVFVYFFQNPTAYKIYTWCVLFVILILLFADVGLFAAWGFRLDDTVFRYLSSPREVWASISHLPLAWIFIGFITIYSLLIFVSGRLMKVKFGSIDSHRGLAVTGLLVIGAAFIIPLRGGFQLAPLNQSSVYFSQNNFANMAAINAPWNFVHAITHHTNSDENPFEVIDTSKTDFLKDSFFSGQPTIVRIIDLEEHPEPNVLIIVWESLTAKAVALFSDNKEVLPGFNQLIKEGVYFSNIYATGDRTDKGIVSILSGYPAQPTTSIVKEPGKASKLAGLGKMFSEKGYRNSFYYGGELEFANIKAYLLQGGFHSFISKGNFNRKDLNSKWGAHDGVVGARLQKDLANSSQPFFSTWLTLSSHEPYEIPVNNYFNGNDDRSKYLSSLHYSDSVIFSFIREAQSQTWWRNTLIVIVADHGHRLPVATDRSDDFKIPLLFLGGVLDSATTVVNHLGNQTGLPTTLAAQLGWKENIFPLSRNLLDTSAKPWSFFSFNNGFGYILPGKKIIFDNVGKRIIQQYGDVTPADVNQGQVLQQIFFQDYLEK